jgi:hypothetical protein
MGRGLARLQHLIVNLNMHLQPHRCNQHLQLVQAFLLLPY